MDADDIWKKEKLQKLADFIGHKPNDFIYHPVKSFGLTSEKARYSYWVKSILDIMVKGNPIVPSAVCLNTNLAKKYLFSTNAKFHGAEDFLLWVQLMHNNHFPSYLNEYLTLYREEGGMSTNFKDHYKKVLNVFEHLLDQKIASKKLIDKARRRKNYEAARFFQKRKQFALAESYYKSSKYTSIKTWLLRLTNFFGLAA